MVWSTCMKFNKRCLKTGHILKQQWRCPTEIYVLTMDSIGKYWFYSFEFWAQVTLLESTPHTDESQRGEWQQHWYGLFLPPPSSHLFYLNQYQQMKHVWRGKGISVRSGCRCQPGVPVIAYHIWKFLHRFNNDTLPPFLEMTFIKKKAKVQKKKKKYALHHRVNFYLFLPFHSIWQGFFPNTTL